MEYEPYIVFIENYENWPLGFSMGAEAKKNLTLCFRIEVWEYENGRFFKLNIKWSIRKSINDDYVLNVERLKKKFNLISVKLKKNHLPQSKFHAP